MTHTPSFLLRSFRPQWRLPLAVLLCIPLSVFGSRTDAKTGQQQKADVSPAADTADTVIPNLRARLTGAQAKFSRFQVEFGSSTNFPPGATQAETIEYRSLLQRCIQTYKAHLDALSEIETIRQRQQDFSRAAQTWTGFAEQPPYSVLLVDEIRDTIQSLEKKIKMEETAQAFIERFSAETGASMKSSEGAIRRLNEQLESLTDPTLTGRLSWLRELEQLRGQAAAASLSALDARRRKLAEELTENRQRLTFANRQLAATNQKVCFTQKDLDKALEHLNGERLRLKAEELSAYARLEESQQSLANARANLQQALQNTAQNASTPDVIRHLQEIVDTRNIQSQANTEIVTCIRQLLRGIDTEQQMWQTRFVIFAKHDAAELQNAYKQLSRLHGLILASKPYFNQQIELATSQVIEQQSILLNNAGSQGDPVLTQERLEAFQRQAAAYRRVQDGLEKHEGLILRWKLALDGDRKTRPLAERVRNFFTGVTALAANAWNFELLVVKDTITVEGQEITGHRGITVGKIMLVILILIIGYGISKRIARWLERLSIRQLKIEPNQANLIRRWSHVILVVCLVLFSLVSVKIPLTIFAFAGGALAIGVGFGTQNLLKNFISGIIILFERPFRVGDVLDVAGQRGKITCIGIRSSVLQLWDGTETLIPNSALLENNLTNWTYSNRTVRFTVTVGVAYGSDTRRVAQLLGEVADRHGLVQKDPKPQIIFTQFGDSALSFDLLYWVDVLKHNSAHVASDLRHMIASTFAEHGVVMAFPQRDVHLDSSKPLKVQVVTQPDTPSDV
ncbi:MAG: mechanosensitive ion channel [Kiritimatiellae bacterium]|nr:mechanosensitive ion channel [Kiritimatiellia bacterium]